jgi:hypothetical protein
VNPKATGLRVVANVANISDVDTIGCANGIVEGPNSVALTYENCSIAGFSSFGIYANQSAMLKGIEMEAIDGNGTNRDTALTPQPKAGASGGSGGSGGTYDSTIAAVPIYVLRSACLEGFSCTPSSAGVLLPYLIEIDASAVAWKWGGLVHYNSGTGSLTHVLKDNRPSYSTYWGDSGGASRTEPLGADKLHVGTLAKIGTTLDVGGVMSANGGLHATTKDLTVQGMQKTYFILRITNSGGVLKHRMTDNDSAALGDYLSKIVAANIGLQATPVGADTTTAFAFGGKVQNGGAGNQHIFIFDTAAQTATKFFGEAVIQFNSVGTVLTVTILLISRNVNGVTQVRPELQFKNAATGVAFLLNTTTIAAGAILDISFNGVLA